MIIATDLQRTTINHPFTRSSPTSTHPSPSCHPPSSSPPSASTPSTSFPRPPQTPPSSPQPPQPCPDPSRSPPSSSNTTPARPRTARNTRNTYYSPWPLVLLRHPRPLAMLCRRAVVLSCGLDLRRGRIGRRWVRFGRGLEGFRRGVWRVGLGWSWDRCWWSGIRRRCISRRRLGWSGGWSRGLGRTCSMVRFFGLIRLDDACFEVSGCPESII
jgi:hypothetical protein